MAMGLRFPFEGLSHWCISQQPRHADLHWELQKLFNAGLDFQYLENRIKMATN